MQHPAGGFRLAARGQYAAILSPSVLGSRHLG